MQLSKELLGNVIGKEIKEFVIEKNELRYILENDTNSIPELYYINIYELAYKCKQWAFDNDYELRNGRDIDVKEEVCYFCEYKQERQLDYANSDYFLAGTEPEAIFKACQWILDNKTNKEG